MRRPLLVLFVVACRAADPSPPAEQRPVLPSAAPARAGLPPPADNYYGVYLNGHKVGWMHNSTVVGERTVDISVDLNASVGGLGSVQKIRLVERRVYDADDGKLSSISFEQQAATGSVKVGGAVKEGTLDLVVTAGGGSATQKHQIADTLASETALRDLAQQGEVGAKKKVSRFDPSVQRQVDVEHEIVAVEERVLAGVPTRTVQVRSTYAALGITESAWVDAHGTVLESKVGGFFVARLEAPDVAKRLDYSQDLLISAVVATPAPIREPEKLDKLEVTFVGFEGEPPPASERQKVEQRADRVKLTLTADPAPSGTLPQARAAEDTPFLEATPFIQSDAAAIRDTAQRIAGGSKDVRQVLANLTSFVYGHVKDEYVPAYSNALEALESGRGDCTEHAILFVALARALDIPARVAVGIAYWPAGAGFGWHAWAEVKTNGRWIAVDPTWNQPVADVTHIKLADGGPAEQARIVMLLGRLRVVSLQT